jgi:hypothetical protein
MLPVTALYSVAAAITASLNVGCNPSKFSLLPELEPNFNILAKSTDFTDAVLSPEPSGGCGDGFDPLLPSLQDYKASLANYFYYYGR